jgi:hypothetical protein
VRRVDETALRRGSGEIRVLSNEELVLFSWFPAAYRSASQTRGYAEGSAGQH